MSHKLAIIGLGYVGLPLAVAFAKKFADVVGFDVNEKKVELLRKGVDLTGETEGDDIKTTTLKVSSDPNSLRDRDIFIVAVPTPVDQAHRPDLSILEKATEIVAAALQPGVIICYESTVYPGVTEEVCAPILERISGLRRGVDFFLGYSPERINPGDKVHRLESITKVVAGEDEKTLETLARVYGTVVEAGIHKAASIKVAEAAKVIENTQRDLNIALMNELALIFDRMELRTIDVLEAAGTKWNFLKFFPGLVGGHCIGVDPFYLTHKAESLGYIPEVILAGRRVNDSMGRFIAEKTVKMLCSHGKAMHDVRVAILGLTFKENVPDIRNSRVPDIVSELKSYGVSPLVYDPLCDPQEAMKEYNIALCSYEDIKELDALVLAVPHSCFIQKWTSCYFKAIKQKGGILIDVKSQLDPKQIPQNIMYWSL